MTRLILTATDSGAGCLLGARIADIVIPLGFGLVWGKPPSDSALEAMLGPASLSRLLPRDLGEFPGRRSGLLELCEHCEAVDLWFDPSPNAQLMLIQLLDCLSSRAKIVPKLTLFQPDVEIGDQSRETIYSWKPPGVKIRRDHLEIASLAWQAFRHPTPQDWSGLLDRDLGALPQLRRTVLELLEELPMPDSGLGATEMRMLQLIWLGHASPFDVFPGDGKPNRRRVFGYWEVGMLLEGLARGPTPAVSGLEGGPFTEEIHLVKARLARYRDSRLWLTNLGRAVLVRAEDFRRHNPVHRWWGGTELRNDNLWRWDARNRALIAP